MRKNNEAFIPGKSDEEITGIRNDIKRDNLEVEAEKDEQNFRFGSLFDHIKKNWSELKSLNKKFF